MYHRIEIETSEENRHDDIGELKGLIKRLQSEELVATKSLINIFYLCQCVQVMQKCRKINK